MNKPTNVSCLVLALLSLSLAGCFRTTDYSNNYYPNYYERNKSFKSFTKGCFNNNYQDCCDKKQKPYVLSQEKRCKLNMMELVK